MPHPPILVPEVGRGEEKKAIKTFNSFERASSDISREKPHTIILTTPHGPVFQDYIHISVTDRLKGNLGRFGAGKVNFDYENDLELVKKIIKKAYDARVPCGGVSDEIARKYRLERELDHGAMVPLYFIGKRYNDFKLVHVSIAGLPFRDLYRFGMCVAEAVRDSDPGLNVTFVASGDLSHRLLKEGNYGFHENGPRFDKLLVESVSESKPENLLLLDEDFCESAGECGLRSFLMMYGALDGMELKSEVYSYEGPFGVGYSLARIEPVSISGTAGSKPEKESLLDRLDRIIAEKTAQIRKNEDPYVALARKSLESYITDGKVIQVPGSVPEEMKRQKAGVFVSIKKNGRLRGCIGTISPVKDSIAEEIIANAISAGVNDPRFDPVTPDELNSLIYSVDILKEPEPIKSIDELDVKKYGVIVRKGYRTGLLLPNLEGIDTPEQQVAIALQKAGIRKDEDYSMERFEVIRHK